jgi:hypothetical protein
MPLSRRQFITACAAAAAPIIAATASVKADEQAKTPPEREHKSGRLGIVIHSYGIRRGAERV